MIFKATHEKAHTQHQLPGGMVEQMVQLAYPQQKLMSYQVISGGCANINIKIQLDGEDKSLVLRIYLRDQAAAYREQKLGTLLKPTVPVPLVYYVGDYDDYRFAITEFMPGITLRELLLSDDHDHDVQAIMLEVGRTLAKITKHEFSSAGFFDQNLNIVTPLAKDDLKQFVISECLVDELVRSQLDEELVAKINGFFEKYDYLLPGENEHHLVHADFDPPNILVSKINNVWEITGVLDWEFAFSGSALFDVANMLRYAHKVAGQYEAGFLDGLQDAGVCLPENWRIIVHMLNLVSLLDCLKRSDPENRPNQSADIIELIIYIVEQLNKLKITKPIEVVPYNPKWPEIFATEAAKIRAALGDNCITVHHIGSTSVPGLAAKPIIDMIPVVRDIMLVDAVNPKMKALGYEARGEYGMVFRRYFKKEDANIHIYEQNSGEIDRCIKFRDWMCANKKDRVAYAKLKHDLAKKFPNDILSYCFGKDSFVAAIDKKTGFSGLRVVKALTPTEWEVTKNFRQKYFFDKVPIADPYTWTFTHQDHVHFVLYQGADIVGYAHLQLWPQQRAAIRIIVIDEVKRAFGLGGQLLVLCEKWLKSQGYKSVHTGSSPMALNFYQKHDYVNMPFNDLDGYEGGAEDIPVGKTL